MMILNPGVETRVNSYTTSLQTYSKIAALSDGGYIVVWGSYGQDGDGFGIYLQRFNAAGGGASGRRSRSTLPPPTINSSHQ